MVRFRYDEIARKACVQYQIYLFLSELPDGQLPSSSTSDCIRMGWVGVAGFSLVCEDFADRFDELGPISRLRIGSPPRIFVFEGDSSHAPRLLLRPGSVYSGSAL